MKYVLDTHVWIWWHLNPGQISKKIISLLSDTSKYDALLLSAISVWEFCKLVEKERLIVNCAPDEWIEKALLMQKLQLSQLSPRIACQSTLLPKPFHDDPADQIITATAREENATLITKDKRLQKYGHVKTVW